MIRNLERFKKTSSSFIVVLMGLAALFTLIIYAYEMYLFFTQYYFVSRTYITITEVIDFETITAQKIQYFLYKNLTEGAKDADGENGFKFIVEHVHETCDNMGFEAYSDIH